MGRPDLKEADMSVRKRVAGIATAAVMLLGIPTAGMAQTQDGLVNVAIGDVTILEDVRVAVAANVVANVCALVNADVVALASDVDAGDLLAFECDQRGSGRPVAITDN